MSQQNPVFEQQAFSVGAFCGTYGVGRSTAYKLIAEGKLETFRLGRRRLISTASARRLMENGLFREAT